MALNSMTGFARGDGARGPVRWHWELRSVNGRGLDLRLRLPQGYEALDAPARAMIQGRLVRGAVQASLQVHHDAGQPDVRVNMEAARRVIEAARALRGREGLSELTMDGLLAVRGVVELIEPQADEAEQEAVRAGMLESLGQALDALCAARSEEGARIEAVIGVQVEAMAALVTEAQACPARQPDAVRERLAEQVRMLADASARLDPDRLHQEAVMMAARADVQEELDRLRSHLAAAGALLAEGGAAGRRLDFLAQEFNREANTLCAKANHASLSAIGLKLKLLVDQFREQVQNIE